MGVLKKLLIGLAALVAALIGIGFTLPDTGRVERSIVIQAAPPTLFALLNGFQRFNEWSPWAGIDPNATVKYEGPATGVGATMSWSGNDAVGSGSQEILESRPHEHIRIKLQFEGWDTQQTATYTLVPEGEGTRLTWTYDGRFGSNIMARYFGLMLDSMIGKDYEKGLAQLKALAEGLPRGDISSLPIEVVEVESMPIAYISGTTTTDPAAIGTAYAVSFSKIVTAMQAAGLKQVAPPLGITRRWDEPGKVLEYDAGIPVDRAEAKLPEGGEVKLGQTYAGRAVRATHRGPYASMGPSYEALLAFVGVNGLTKNGNPWEHYVTDPARTPEAELITYIYFPVK